MHPRASRRRFFTYLSAVACTAGAPGVLHAQKTGAVGGFPERPLRLVVGIGAGSTTDLLARIAARHLAEALGQPVVVDNRPGAGGTLGAGAVAAAPADGHTLLFTSSSLPTFSHFYDALKFDPAKDLVGAGGLAQGGMVMLTRAEAPWKSAGDLIADAKQRPAASVTYASAGIGSIAYLYSELLAQTAGVQFLHVPYKSSAAALADLLAGQVDFVFDGPTTAQPQLASGRVRALGYSAAQRSPFLPQVPTLREAGVAAFAERTWFGLMAPRGTPTSVLQRIAAAVATFVDKPAYRDELGDSGHAPMAMSAERFTQLVRDEDQAWSARIARMRKPAS